MTKIRVSPQPVKAGRRPASVSSGHITTEKGEKKRVMTVQANSASFGSDFLYVFKENVRAARVANKKKVGSPNGVKSRR